jgi:hypothetical protein
MILWVVFEAAEIPMMQRQPSQNIDDMGATLKLPSSLQVLISTTGVPKYRISGSLCTCIFLIYDTKLSLCLNL